MKEIGGYFELERFTGKPYHENVIGMNLGRTALLYLLELMGIRVLYVPHFLCGSVLDTVEAAPVEVRKYAIGEDLLPLHPGKMESGECLYLVNFYGQLTNDQIAVLRERYGSVMVDNTHAFFQKPVDTVPTLYSIRKFFGLSDGAYIYLPRDLAAKSKQQGLSYAGVPMEQDVSCERMTHILGRYEQGASMHYQTMLNNAHSYDTAPPRLMSALTENLLRGIDYGFVRERRERNYRKLEELLGNRNKLKYKCPEGAFAYPFYFKDGMKLRRAMAKEKVFVPTYWNNIFEQMPENSLEYDLAANILPLPCDQRYDETDMERVAQVLLDCMEEL